MQPSLLPLVTVVHVPFQSEVLIKAPLNQCQIAKSGTKIAGILHFPCNLRGIAIHTELSCRIPGSHLTHPAGPLLYFLRKHSHSTLIQLKRISRKVFLQLPQKSQLQCLTILWEFPLGIICNSISAFYLNSLVWFEFFGLIYEFLLLLFSEEMEISAVPPHCHLFLPSLKPYVAATYRVLSVHFFSWNSKKEGQYLGHRSFGVL